ncbi:MAG: hypothetical protein N0C84_00790 [Candidatus Thiodiazotropha taylori]|uniref:Uncharacterized protein n=1 Tax=Candidatus Thiodiazotropha taylori TaxID=2792791 RepID=A0A9E4K9F0_9GAMM|nr:hypothetical protein [Candidatus Thiodiazotropha taylori]MCW4254982.1 hypothetical protein [Candidatus Thiodiazotropha taylori]
MPTYTFQNKNTKEFSEHYMSMSELDEFKKNNPDLEQILITGPIIGGTSSSGGKLPEGFKDRLREMKKKHPHGKGIHQV